MTTVLSKQLEVENPKQIRSTPPMRRGRTSAVFACVHQRFTRAALSHRKEGLKLVEYYHIVNHVSLFQSLFNPLKCGALKANCSGSSFTWNSPGNNNHNDIDNDNT
jgi:hypothetical protein